MLSRINQSHYLLNHSEVKDKQEMTELCIPGTSSVNLQTSQSLYPSYQTCNFYMYISVTLLFFISHEISRFLSI